ncbi:DNA polymerase Y family protein [Nitrospira calida]|jgi:DNA polymerase-4
MDRQIVCFAIPSFELALVRLTDPTLRTRPLALAPLATPRALLHDVSPEAEREGLQAGMPVELARRVCPSLQVIAPDPHRVRLGHQRLLAIIARYAPVWELARPGTVLMDVTGTSRLFGPACDVAARVQRELYARDRLDGVAGVGSNKLVAQTAAKVIEPAELYEVRPGAERLFMAPLSVRLLPGLQRPGLRAVLTRLEDLNLRTCGDVAESPLAALALAIGDLAGPLSHWAQGIDQAPVLPPTRQPALEETIILEPDEIDDAVLWSRLLQGLRQLCRILRQHRRVCRRLSLAICSSDQVQVMKQARVTPETCWEVDLAPLLAELFRRCARRRIRLRRMTVGLSDLAPLAEQQSLFEDRSSNDLQRERAKRLAVALDQLHAKFGERAIGYGGSL